jgi:hypothetical protein
VAGRYPKGHCSANAASREGARAGVLCFYVAVYLSVLLEMPTSNLKHRKYENNTDRAHAQFLEKLFLS